MCCKIRNKISLTNCTMLPQHVSTSVSMHARAVITMIHEAQKLFPFWLLLLLFHFKGCTLRHNELILLIKINFDKKETYSWLRGKQTKATWGHCMHDLLAKRWCAFALVDILRIRRMRCNFFAPYQVTAQQQNSSTAMMWRCFYRNQLNIFLLVE